MNISVQIAKIADAKGKPPYHIDYLKKDEMANIAETVLPQVELWQETLRDIRDLARTGLKPDALNLTQEQWLQEKLNRIAGMANRALEEK